MVYSSSDLKGDTDFPGPSPISATVFILLLLSEVEGGGGGGG